MADLFTTTSTFSELLQRIACKRGARFIGLAIIELMLAILLWAPFLQTTSAHALPDDLESNRPVNDAAGFGQIDTSRLDNGPEVAIPTLQGVPATTLTISIETSPDAIIDNNFSPSSKTRWPEVTVIAGVVTNTGVVTAEGVEVLLDYNESGSWVLIGNEIPTRTVSSLAPGAVEWVYWFAGYISDTADITHTYTVSATADNADPVSTSENSHNPGVGYTIETVEYDSSASQGLEATAFGVNVGVAFTVTQVFSTSTLPDTLVLGPIGNADFDAGAYHLKSINGRFLSGTVELGTWTDEVYVTVPTGVIEDNIDSVEVNYEFVPVLPRSTTACSYMGVIKQNTKKYDNSYCEGSQVMNIDGTLSISMTKEVDKVDVEQGESLLYTITYTNNATSTIGSLWIWDDVPPKVSILDNTISPTSPTYVESQSSDTRVTWHVQDIGPQDSGTLSFSVLVDGNGTDIADNTVLLNEANLAILEPSLAADDFRVLSETVTTTVHAPVLAISKTDGKTTASPGETLTYIIDIVNTGSTDAAGLIVTDTLPSNIVTPVATPDPTNTGGDGTTTLTWNNLTVAAGATRTLTVTVQVDPELSGSGTDITNNAEVSFQNAEAHTFPSQTAQDTTTVIVPTSSLTLTKTAEDLNGEPLVVGETIRYSVQVTNTGAFTAYNVVVSDTLSTDVTCVNVTSTGGSGAACPTPPARLITWNVGNIGIDESETMTIDVTINQDVAAGTSIVNSASVSSTNVTTPPTPPEVCPDGSEPNSSGICDDPGSTPDPATTLGLTKTADADDPLEVGGNITYTIQVTNTGAFTAYNVTVTDDLPDEVDCVSATATPGPSPACNDPLNWNVGTLSPKDDPGSTASLVVVVEVKSSGAGQSITNTVSVTATNVPTPPTVPPVCPDGSTTLPCPDNTIPPAGGGIFLPIIVKNN